ATGLGWLSAADSGYTYSNPYYTEPAMDVPASLNYAQPLVIQAPPEPEPEPEVPTEDTATPSLTPPPPPDPPPEEEPQEDPAVREAMDLLDEARTAFAQGDYAKAQELIEKGIQKVPGDATLHETRGLIQFARKKYRDAAGTIYAVLSVGPGWDWETM